MCFYFVFTVFATVGFGDIYAVNTSERVCAVCLIGAPQPISCHEAYLLSAFP